MESINKEPVTNYRGQLVDRMKTKYPDRVFEAENGLDSPNSLEQAILEALDDDDKRIADLTAREDEYNSKTGVVTKLFYGSPRAAVFMNTLAETQNPGAAIYKAYGKEAYKAFVDGDASELITKIESEDAKLRADNDALEAEKTENIRASLERLDAFGDRKGLSQDEKVNLFLGFHEKLTDALMGIYSDDLFEMVYKALHYDMDVDTARHEGEVNGRNAKIKEMTRKRQENSYMPPVLSGQGVAQGESRPKAEEDDNPWML